MTTEFSGKIHGVPEGKPPAIEVLQCSHCEGIWMETKIVQMVQKQQVLLGQACPPAIDPANFYIYQCLDCDYMNQPQLVYSGLTQERQIYEALLKVIKRHNDGIVQTDQ